ncbi:MAG: peptidoglycan bridge formation glycyltransferase FemA/FemB family protein [Candidatus Moranbacteria bacterium]|nr:peptidoglycan bridge formation glycyltransferase FemA/FemB family protein [Candidatus Moranbacteria bacterium]
MTDELLQSEEWMRFQETVGRRTARICGEGWIANGVVHRLPIVGEYLYVPRGPKTVNSEQVTENKGDGFRNSTKASILNDQTEAGNKELRIKKGELNGIMEMLFTKAKELKIGWIRIEPETADVLSGIRDAAKDMMTVRAPHDMQPRETFRVGLAPSEENLLSAMKSKTRYNIRIAEKRGVSIAVSTERKYREAFIRLVTGTADRKGIVPHPKTYYEAMCTALLGEDGVIFVAEKEGTVVAANLVIFHGKTATYLHGGSDDRFRADMAPFLLQWEGMREAKRRGCSWYDFGGVNVADFMSGHGKWLGITRFKFGFSPATAAVVFPGTYDIVLSPWRYMTYRFIQRIQSGVIHVFGK